MVVQKIVFLGKMLWMDSCFGKVDFIGFNTLSAFQKRGTLG